MVKEDILFGSSQLTLCTKPGLQPSENGIGKKENKSNTVELKCFQFFLKLNLKKASQKCLRFTFNVLINK